MNLPPKIANFKASDYTTRKLAFDGSNLYARWVNDHIYVVYSYGTHFPIYVWSNGVWIANTDKYSVTTSKHMTQARPIVKEFIYGDTGFLGDASREGFAMALHLRSEQRIPAL